MVTRDKPTRAPSLGDQLAAVLRDQIIRGAIAPGTRLVEDALAADYDVSRGPVRDALRALELQGIVESRRRGFFVVGFTSTDIADLYELREAIEAVAVGRAVSAKTPEQMARARGIVSEMVSAADHGSARAFAEADVRFHALLYTMGANRRLIDVWEHYEPVIATLVQLTVEEDVDLHPSAEDHSHLLDLIELADIEAVHSELRAHLRSAHARMHRVFNSRLHSGATASESTPTTKEPTL